MMNLLQTRGSAGRVRAASLALVALLSATPVSARNACFRAQVPARMRLPDGSIHSPGLLRICEERTLSPVERLYTVSVDDGVPSPFLGREEPGPRNSDALAGVPVFMFRREEAGILRFEALLVTGDGVAHPRPPRLEAALPGPLRANRGATGDGETVLLAATGN